MLFLTPTDSVKTLKALRVYFVIMETFSLQCFDAAGWVTGRASGL